MENIIKRYISVKLKKELYCYDIFKAQTYVRLLTLIIYKKIKGREKMKTPTLVSLLKEEVSIEKVQFFIVKKEKKEANVYFLKELMEKDGEKDFVAIKTILDSYSDKEQIQYEIHYDRSTQLIRLENSEVDELKYFCDIRKKLETPLNLSTFDKNGVDLVILKIKLINNKGEKYEILFICNYNYNGLLKKNAVNRIFGTNGDLVSQEKFFIVDYHPMAILFSDGLTLISPKIESKLDFHVLHEKKINENKELLEKILECSVEKLKNKENNKYLYKGLLSKNIHSFDELGTEEKKIQLELLRKGYVKKEKKEVEISLLDNGKIKYDKKMEKHVIQLLSNKAGIKIRDGEVATTI